MDVQAAEQQVPVAKDPEYKALRVARNVLPFFL